MLTPTFIELHLKKEGDQIHQVELNRVKKDVKFVTNNTVKHF